MKSLLDQRPIVVALAGPNGAGKSTFYGAHLSRTGLYFVNADVLAAYSGMDPYAAAELADLHRRQLVEQRESFIFETVFSDPKGEKLDFLKQAEGVGYTVVLLFIGLESAATSDNRVTMRVLQGGHDVPAKKLKERFPRTLQNLQRALRELSNVWVFDNSNLGEPYRLVARRQNGEAIETFRPVPTWLRRLLSES